MRTFISSVFGVYSGCVVGEVIEIVSRNQLLELYGQATKRTRWMPRQLEAMKDVGACDKVRGAGKHALIRTFPNGETHSLR